MFEPSEDLSMLVKCYWTLQDAAGDQPQRQSIVPDGCMEMIIHYGGLYLQYNECGSSFLQPRCFVMGQLSRPLEIEPSGSTEIFSVRFRPHGFTHFSTFPIKKMENTGIPLESIFGADGKHFENEMLSIHNVSNRIERVERFLLERLARSETADQIVRSTVEMIITANGQIPIKALSHELRISMRQLERKFHSAIWMSPKKLSKIIRFQGTLKMMLTKEYSSFTSMAHANNYYDQAHFIRDFRELVGVSPKEFYGKHLTLSTLFYGTK
ncbi:MAG: AraC family transcriptional regulator [Chryseobacterium sp.]|jgi:AraC-like DNA-binding protein|uniref:DUF6597 domain-containing transcriptional factor n=1 Tax=Chryseobacterium sp. TaxID=1871047 RepID=UPI002A697C16|nr:AraC family transcriptional regulator [Chryseobacterium sp.]